MANSTVEHLYYSMRPPPLCKWLVWIALACQQIQSYSISYTDCLAPKSVKQYQYSSICPEAYINEEVELGTHLTILQKPAVKRIQGHSCFVEATRFYFKCGTWGHLKMQAVPEIQHRYPVSVSSCRRMIHSSTFAAPGRSQPYTIKLNEVAFLEIVEKGDLLEKNQAVSCTGEPVHIKGTLHTNIVELVEYRVLIRDESFLVSEDSVEAEGDHVKLRCPYRQLGCETGGSTYTWDVDNHPCPLEIVRTIEPRKTLGTYLVDHGVQFLVNTTGTTTYQSCPFSLTQTDHPNIFLAETSKVIALPAVAPADVDTALQASIHLNYLGYQIERKFASLKVETSRVTCLNQKREEDSNEPVLMEDGSYGLRTGNVYLKFACESKTGKIREADRCFTDIPIQPEGFVTPRTRQFTVHSTPIPCSKTFPLVVDTNEGWVEITPKLKVRPAPLIARLPGTTPVEHTDYSHGGLYSDSELQDWHHQILFPAYHQALLRSITYGTCVQDGSCATSVGDDITPYDLNNLIPDLEKKFDLWGQLKAFLHQYGDLAAFLCLFIIGFKLLIDIVMIMLTLMKAGPAAAVAMVAQLYFYNRDTYRKIMRRHQKMHQTTTENVPLVTTTNQQMMQPGANAPGV